MSKERDKQTEEIIDASLPWNHYDLKGWRIKLLYHHTEEDGTRTLNVTMKRGDQSIRADGPYEQRVFEELRKKARALAMPTNPVDQ